MRIHSSDMEHFNETLNSPLAQSFNKESACRKSDDDYSLANRKGLWGFWLRASPSAILRYPYLLVLFSLGVFWIVNSVILFISLSGTNPILSIILIIIGVPVFMFPYWLLLNTSLSWIYRASISGKTLPVKLSLMAGAVLGSITIYCAANILFLWLWSTILK